MKRAPNGAGTRASTGYRVTRAGGLDRLRIDGTRLYHAECRAAYTRGNYLRRKHAQRGS